MLTKLDLQDAYHLIYIRPEDVEKVASRTRYGHFEYAVVPFGLTNAPATFQAYMQETLQRLLDHCCVAYMDDILIFSKDDETHTEDVCKVLDRLPAYSLSGKTSRERMPSKLRYRESGRAKVVP